MFGLLKRLFVSSPSPNTSREQPLKILVMSATLNHEKFSRFFGGCPVFEIPGRCFPVKNIYCNYVGKQNLKNPDYLTKVSANRP